MRVLIHYLLLDRLLCDIMASQYFMGEPDLLSKFYVLLMSQSRSLWPDWGIS